MLAATSGCLNFIAVGGLSLVFTFFTQHMEEKSAVEAVVKALKPFLLLDEKLLEEMKEQALIMEKQSKIKFALQAQLTSITTQKPFTTVIEEMSNEI